MEVTHDEELTLYAVTTFKKTAAEFVHKCREAKWTPREYKYVEGGREEEKREMERVEREERKLWGEILRLARTGYSESMMIWIHVLCLRVFVETVLRYGLPLEFVSALIKVSVFRCSRTLCEFDTDIAQTTPKQSKKVKGALHDAFSYLGGNAFGRDKKGRVAKDDSALSSEMSAAGVSGGGEGGEYTPYVYYEFEIV